MKSAPRVGAHGDRRFSGEHDGWLEQEAGPRGVDAVAQRSRDAAHGARHPNKQSSARPRICWQETPRGNVAESRVVAVCLVALSAPLNRHGPGMIADSGSGDTAAGGDNVQESDGGVFPPPDTPALAVGPSRPVEASLCRANPLALFVAILHHRRALFILAPAAWMSARRFRWSPSPDARRFGGAHVSQLYRGPACPSRLVDRGRNHDDCDRVDGRLQLARGRACARRGARGRARAWVSRCPSRHRGRTVRGQSTPPTCLTVLTGFLSRARTCHRCASRAVRAPA